MGKLVIAGGKKLEGEIQLQGAKNAVLPILAASLLNGGQSVISNCPALSDVSSAIEILISLGCSVEQNGNTIKVDSSQLKNHEIPDRLMREMRSSIMFLGAILARCKNAVISYPGGCEIGPRPVDLHIKALKELGVCIHEEHGFINCHSDHIVGTQIHLAFPSVGATENVMLAAAMADGETVLSNPALEPEIVDLQNFINAMGGKIKGAGTKEIRIQGVKQLHDVEYSVIPDRIVAATYLAGAAITGGDIKITHAVPDHVTAVLSVLKDMGCQIEITTDEIRLIAPDRLHPVNLIRTQVYPGFPTDAQAPIMACLAMAQGTSILAETIFENRFRHVEEMNKMGADINVDGRCAIIRGVKELKGASVMAKELRGGAALIVAGLAAYGTTEIEGVEYIDRGYQEIEKTLQKVGADIKRI